MRTACAAVAAAVLIASGCGGSDSRKRPPREPDSVGACVTAWNRPANFERGGPGAHVRRLEPRAAGPQFAHLSRDRDGGCIVFTGDGYSLTCVGACGQHARQGARTFQFRPDGSLPAL